MRVTRFLLGFQAAMLVPLAAASAEVAQSNVAVLDFSANNVSAGEASVVTEFVRAAMVRSGKYPVVDRNNMARVLQEQAFQQTGCTSEDCAVKLGKVLNVHKVVVGEYSVLEGTKFLTAKLVDVETGRIEGTGRVKEFTVATADEAADRLVTQITGMVVAPVRDPAPRKPGVPVYDGFRFSIGWGATYGTMDVFTDYGGAPGGPYTGTARTVELPRAGGMMKIGVRMPLGGRWGIGLDTAAAIEPGSSDAGGTVEGVSSSTGRPVSITPEVNGSIRVEADLLGTYRLGRFVFAAGGGASVNGVQVAAEGRYRDATGTEVNWRSEPPDANLIAWSIVAGVEWLIGRDWSLEVTVRQEVAGADATKTANISLNTGSPPATPFTSIETVERSGIPWLSAVMRVSF